MNPDVLVLAVGHIARPEVLFAASFDGPGLYGTLMFIMFLNWLTRNR